ncbi:hypothetical protein [Methylobacterium longum]|uniref:Uncharacterized protein n=1 Tax=Methylobacterium longum TaxID=767694 RepID=A0ABT8AS48_9HYPH|nr:hypothetical protein [Methylobacterium longum]MDN3572083.1 hypothetical protein [Methylobacterium longum]GJE11064.1 hypothetical protein FOHLNKBM_2102 [Methylobacterium longum]
MGAPCTPSAQPDIFAVIGADLRFFARRPSQDYRLRLAAPCEIEEARAKLNMVPPPPGARAFVGVHRVGRGGLQRVVGFAIDAGEVDFDEVSSRFAYLRLQRQDVTRRPASGSLWRADPHALGGRR